MPRYVRLTGLVLAATLAIAVTGCADLRGSGKIVSQEYDATGVTRVELSVPGGLTIVGGSAEKLVVETDDNILDYVRVRVDGDTLKIGWRPAIVSGLDPTKLQLRLEIPALEAVLNSGEGAIAASGLDMDDLEVTLSGSGAISIDDVDCDDLEAKVSGSGAVEIIGRCARQQAELSGSGVYDGSNLKAKTASVTVSGSGTATVWVVDELEAKVSGSGTITYYGDPDVDASTPGSGSIRGRGER